VWGKVCVASDTGSSVLGPPSSHFPIPIGRKRRRRRPSKDHRISNSSQLSVNNKLLICFVWPVRFHSIRFESIQFDPMRYGLCWFWPLPLEILCHYLALCTIDWLIYMNELPIALWLPYFPMEIFGGSHIVNDSFSLINPLKVV